MSGRALAFAAAAAAALSLGCPHQGPADRGHAQGGTGVTFGPLDLEIAVESRASMFHAVDQMAGYPQTHSAFDSIAFSPPLSGDEKEALAMHRAVRADHPAGSGLEEAYYLGHSSSIDDGTRAKEDRVIARLSKRLKPFLGKGQPHVSSFAQTLREELPTYSPTFEAIGTLAGTPKRALPIALVARPGAGVGVATRDGGVLVVEVTEDEASLTPLVHEAVHALLDSRRDAIRAAASRCHSGLDSQTLEEGVAMAVAPGMIHDGARGDDPLSHAVASDNGKFEGPVRFRALGLAMRPAISHALDGGSFEGLLSDGCEAWKRIRR